jgi:hypothetical protein
VFRRVHVSRDANVAPQQRLFFTLEAMGLLEQYHDKVFAAMHVERLRLNSDEQVFDWAAKNGIDRASFIDTYRSFGIQQRLRRADAMMDAYRVDRWPMVVDRRPLADLALARQRTCRRSAQRSPAAAGGAAGDGLPGGQGQTMSGLRRCACSSPARPAASAPRWRASMRPGAPCSACWRAAATPRRPRRHPPPSRTPPRVCARRDRPRGAGPAARDFIAAHDGADVVIASAGISHGTLTERPEDLPLFDAVFATNVGATIATFAPFIAAMKSQPARAGWWRSAAWPACVA